MPEGFEIAKEDTGGKRPSWVLIVIIIGVIGAIVAATIAFTGSRDTTPQLTLADVNGAVGGVKTEVLWCKETLANLQSDIDALANLSGPDDILDVLSTLRDEIAGLTGTVNSLYSLLLSVNTTLMCCNCTCGGT